MTGTPRSRLARYVPPESTTTGYLLRLSQPRFWFSLAGPALVGIVYAADGFGDLVSPVAVALFAYFLVPANVFLYGVDDVFDADAHESGEGDRAVRSDGSRAVPAAVAACALAGLAFLPVLPRAGAAAVAGFLLLGLADSAPPLRFETSPFLDSLSNGLYVLPGVAAYVAVAGTLPPLAAVVGGWLWTMGVHTFSAIPDVGQDRAAGIRTTATLLGGRNALRYCATVWLLAALAFASLHPAMGALFAVYPALALGVPLAGVAVDRADRWVPVLNTAVGAALTVAGLRVLVSG